MQVENIECQIAQAQIGNFLAGSGLSQEAMQQLEDHIAGCANCKAVLSERRNELKAMLTGDRAVVDFEKIAREAEGTKAKSIATALRKKSLQQMMEPTQELPFVYQQEPTTRAAEPKAAAIEQIKAAVAQQQAVVEAPQKPAKKAAPKWKPLAYSLGLAAVLVGMSLFSNNIAAIFGPKANAATKISSEPEKVVADSPSTTSEPTASTSTPVSNPVTTPISETSGQTVPSTDTTGNSASSTAGTEQPTTSEVTKPSEPTTAVTPPKAADPVVEPTGLAALALGQSAGALATTQFDAPDPATEPIAKPAANVVKPTVPAKPATLAPAKPVVKKAPVKRIATRRITPRRFVRKPVRRVLARKPAVRSRGIKVYNPN